MSAIPIANPQKRKTITSSDNSRNLTGLKRNLEEMAISKWKLETKHQRTIVALWICPPHGHDLGQE